MKISLILLIILFSSALDAEVAINSDGNIEYVGSITAEKNMKVFALYDSSPVKPERFIITSAGGNTDYGIQLGEWLLENQLAVEIGDYCMSSCANYVFLAAREKIIGKHSFIGFHGGLLQRADLPFADKKYLQVVSELTVTCDLELFHQSYKSQLAFPFSDSRLRECLLMQSAGVDYKILVVGQFEKYRTQILPFGFWSYDLDALAALGVNHLTLKDGTWLPPRAVDGNEIFYFSVEDIKAINTYRSHSKWPPTFP